MSVCIYTHMYYIHLYISTYACICMHAYTYVYVYTYVCIQLYTCVYMYDVSIVL